jgi:hypothetical protein
MRYNERHTKKQDKKEHKRHKNGEKARTVKEVENGISRKVEITIKALSDMTDVNG